MSFKNIIEDLREKEYFYKDKKGKWKLHRNPNPNSKIIAEWKLEKTADETFSDLFYDKQENAAVIEFVKGSAKITFYKEYKEIFIGNLIGYGLNVNMQELQAINKKCQEMGWLE